MKKSFMWLVVTVLIATFLVSFSLAGCKEPEEVVEAEAEVYKITILCANFDDKWMSYMHQGMEEYAATITDIAEVTLVDAANESATQISQAENAIAQGVDALVIVALNTIEDNPIVDMAIDAGIPLVSINRLMKRQELVDVYVGSDEQVAGELQMGYLAEASGGEGGLVIIQGELSHSGAIGRTIGFENILEGYPGIEEVARDTCNW
ncbi:MAG: substrate-binding domain-containing protein, partial [Actinomycetia bacterium]|nr:substrate-binding domain-containing protein [Actinomycetes bacterium]